MALISSMPLSVKKKLGPTVAISSLTDFKNRTSVSAIDGNAPDVQGSRSKYTYGNPVFIHGTMLTNNSSFLLFVLKVDSMISSCTFQFRYISISTSVSNARKTKLFSITLDEARENLEATKYLKF